LLGKDITSTRDAGSMDASDLAACRLECQRFGCGGFVVFNGKAHFRDDTAGKCLASLKDRPGCTAFINTGAKKSVTPAPQESAFKMASTRAGEAVAKTVADRLLSQPAVQCPVAGIPLAPAVVPAYSVSTALTTAAWDGVERPVDEGCVPRRPRASSRVLSPTRRRADLDRVSSGSELISMARDAPRLAYHGMCLPERKYCSQHHSKRLPDWMRCSRRHCARHHGVCLPERKSWAQHHGNRLLDGRRLPLTMHLPVRRHLPFARHL